MPVPIKNMMEIVKSLEASGMILKKLSETVYSYHCQHCDEDFFVHRTAEMHVRSTKHQDNVPDENGNTQKRFNYMLVEACMAGKCNLLIIIS